MYKKIINKTFDNEIIIQDDIRYIPVCEQNRHYQEYLRWIEEGNEPEIIEIT